MGLLQFAGIKLQQMRSSCNIYLLIKIFSSPLDDKDDGIPEGNTLVYIAVSKEILNKIVQFDCTRQTCFFIHNISNFDFFSNTYYSKFAVLYLLVSLFTINFFYNHTTNY